MYAYSTTDCISEWAEMLNRIKVFLTNNILLAVLLLPAQQAISATATEQIEAMIKQGQLNEALNLTNQSLAEDRENVSYLFLKGLILTRQNKLDTAKEIFIRLTQEHPELPEPFNNLAVIYAEQGDFNNAREALQMAINTHPSYATAQENLGDIYAKMASKAYNQALELDQDNTSAREKLLLVSDLFSIRNAEQAHSTQVNNDEAEKIASELERLEQELKNAEIQTQVEISRVDEARQELNRLREERSKTIEALQAQQLRAEQEAREAIDQAQAAKAELTGAQQQASQASQASQQAQLEQQQAEAQISKLKTDIAAITSELNQLTANREKAVLLAATEQQQTEEQTRTARTAAVQARTELEELEQRAKEMQASMDRQAAAAEERLNQSRQELREKQAEISQLEQQRTAMTGQAEQDRVQAQARVEDNRAELEKISTELTRLQRERTALESQNRQVTVQLEDTAGAQPASLAQTSRPSEADLVTVVKLWAQQWSAKDVEGYLSAYADDFRPPDGSSRSTWAAQRRDRIRKPRFIRVELAGIKVRFLNDQYAQVNFKQSYQSESFKDNVDKTLLLRLQNGRWVIAEETSG